MWVSDQTNISQKQTGCFWQSFGGRYQNVFAGVWRTRLSNLQTVRCFSWQFDRKHCVASSKTFNPVSSRRSSSASSFYESLLIQEVNHFKNGTRSSHSYLSPNNGRQSQSPIPESTSRRCQDVRKNLSCSRSPLNRYVDQKRPRYWKAFSPALEKPCEVSLPENKHKASKCICVCIFHIC